MNLNKTSGASTPSRDGANTPTRKNFNDVQQQLGENKGIIHDLTANINRKYPIDRLRANPASNDSGRNTCFNSSNNTFPQFAVGDQIDMNQPNLGVQNSYDERDNRRQNFGTGGSEQEYETEFQNFQDNNYWEREHEQPPARENKVKRKKIQPNSFDHHI